MSIKLSSEQEDEIVLLYKNKQPVGEICLRFQINKTTLYATLRRNGLKTRRVFVTLDDEQRKQVADRYIAGEHPRDIAKVFGCDYATVYNILRKLGVETRTRRPTVLTDEIRQQVIAFADGDRTSQEIADSINISRESVFKILNRAGISIPNHQRLYNVNESIFDTLTPESLYWLGFLFADGYVESCERFMTKESNRQRAVVVGLAEKDVEHLKRLRIFCGSEHPIRRQVRKRDGRAYVYWNVKSNHMSEALERVGLVVKRTRTPSNELAASRDFWRGMVDGDGCLGTFKCRKYIYPHIGLVGQQPLLDAFTRFLTANDLTNLRVTRNNSCWGVSTTGSTAAEIIRVLYDENVVALPRKDQRASAIIAGDIRRFAPYVEDKQKPYDEESDHDLSF